MEVWREGNDINHHRLFTHRGHAHMNSSYSELDEDARQLSKGDRVHLSELGCSRHPRDSQKRGTIVGPTQYPNSLRVIWDGSRWPIPIHRDYLQLLKEEISNADGRSNPFRGTAQHQTPQN